MAQLGAFELISGRSKQRERPPQHIAVAAAAIGVRRLPGPVHDIWPHRIRVWCEQGALPIVGRTAAGRELRSFKETSGALIKTKKDVVIDPIEIQQKRNGFTNADVGEHRTTRIEHKSRHAAGKTNGQSLLHHPTVTYRREVVGSLPASGIEFRPHVIQSAFESLQLSIGVAIVLKSHFIEIPEAAVHGEIAAPVIWIALEGE